MGGAVSSGKDNNDLVDNLVASNFLKTGLVERVFRAVDRADYMLPEARGQAYKDLAWKNGFLHLSAPCIYSEVMEGLEFSPGTTFLNVGSGTGYLSTMAGLILGTHGINHGIEIHKTVISYAEQRLREFLECSPAIDEFEFCEPKFIQGNGLCLAPLLVQYDRVYCGAGCPTEYQNYLKQLIKVGGILVMPLNENLLQIRRVGQTEWKTKSLLNVSFATLLVPTREETSNLLKTLEMSPPALQVLARAAIRCELRAAVFRDDPELENQPIRPVHNKKNNPRRICIPLEDDSDNEDLNALHDLDPETGANEMNALLSLVLSMGQNRIAGAIRFDHPLSSSSSSDTDLSSSSTDTGDHSDSENSGDDKGSGDARVKKTKTNQGKESKTKQVKELNEKDAIDEKIGETETETLETKDGNEAVEIKQSKLDKKVEIEAAAGPSKDSNDTAEIEDNIKESASEQNKDTKENAKEGENSDNLSSKSKMRKTIKEIIREKVESFVSDKLTIESDSEPDMEVESDNNSTETVKDSSKSLSEESLDNTGKGKGKAKGRREKFDSGIGEENSPELGSTPEKTETVEPKMDSDIDNKTGSDSDENNIRPIFEDCRTAPVHKATKRCHLNRSMSDSDVSSDEESRNWSDRDPPIVPTRHKQKKIVRPDPCDVRRDRIANLLRAKVSKLPLPNPLKVFVNMGRSFN